MQRRITKDLLTYLPGKVLPALASFITVPIYTRLFSPDEFGRYVLAATASEFLLLATITGFGQGAVRFFSTYERKSGLSSYFAVVFGSVVLITLAAAVLCAGLLFAFRTLIPGNFYPLLWAAIVLFVVSAFFSTLTDVLRGQEKSRWYSAVWISTSFGGIIFGLILVLGFKMGIAGLIWGQILALTLLILPLIWITTRTVKVQPTHVNRSDMKQIWTFAMPFTVANLAFWSLSSADRYIVERYRGSYEVGLYSVSNKIAARTIQLLVSLFFLVPYPIVCRTWEERGREATEEALTIFTRMFFLIVIPAVVGLTVVAAPSVRLLADVAYFDGFRAIWLIAFAAMALGLVELGRIGCLVTNRTGLIARNQCIAAGINLILNFILVPQFGYMGAALGSLLSFSFLAGLQAVTSSRFLTWRWPLNSLWRVLIASGAMAASVLLVQSGLPSSTILWQALSLLVSIIIGGLIYALILWILGEISPKQLLGIFSPGQTQVVSSSVTNEIGNK